MSLVIFGPRRTGFPPDGLPIRVDRSRDRTLAKRPCQGVGETALRSCSSDRRSTFGSGSTSGGRYLVASALVTTGTRNCVRPSDLYPQFTHARSIQDRGLRCESRHTLPTRESIPSRFPNIPDSRSVQSLGRINAAHACCFRERPLRTSYRRTFLAHRCTFSNRFTNGIRERALVSELSKLCHPSRPDTLRTQY
jgi:hypothetical protein